MCLEFLQRLRAEGVVVNEAHALAHASTLPFAAALELLRAQFGISDADDEHAAREKVAGRLLTLDASLTDALPLIFDFLGVSGPERTAPAPPAYPDRYPCRCPCRRPWSLGPLRTASCKASRF